MATTTFTGPITAGSILETSGSTVGTNIANVGTAILGQIVALTQAGSATAKATTIVVPAGSTIVSIDLFVTVAWDGSSSTLSIGTSATSNELATAVAGGTVGKVSVTPGTDATRTANWVDVGTTDVQINVLSANTGNGVGALVVRYIQGPNSV